MVWNYSKRGFSSVPKPACWAWICDHLIIFGLSWTCWHFFMLMVLITMFYIYIIILLKQRKCVRGDWAGRWRCVPASWRLQLTVVNDFMDVHFNGVCLIMAFRTSDLNRGFIKGEQTRHPVPQRETNKETRKQTGSKRSCSLVRSGEVCSQFSHRQMWSMFSVLGDGPETFCDPHQSAWPQPVPLDVNTFPYQVHICASSGSIRYLFFPFSAWTAATQRHRVCQWRCPLAWHLWW